jgi:hypothetical protein
MKETASERMEIAPANAIEKIGTFEIREVAENGLNRESRRALACRSSEIKKRA